MGVGVEALFTSALGLQPPWVVEDVIDETSLKRGQHYITVVHDLDAKRLLFATEGRDHQTMLDFAADLQAHGGDPAEVRHACMDMSTARGYRTAQNFIAIAYLRLSRLKNLPAHPFSPAAPVR